MFFSLSHITYMLLPLILLAALYLTFRNKSMLTRKIAVFSLSALNLLQHLLKIYIYPQYWGEDFGARSTAYNMCAFLIIASPFIFLVGSELWQNFIVYVGTVAGFASLCVTYWLGEPIVEQLRFVICHSLLFISSILPALFGIYRINYRKFWRLPFVFYTALMILILNDIITFELNMVGYTGDITLYEFLVNQNPCWVMGPPDNYPFVERLIAPLTPDIFLASGPIGKYTPILWYAIPLFILIAGGALILGIIFDNRRFKSDVTAIKDKAKKLFIRLK